MCNAVDGKTKIVVGQRCGVRALRVAVAIAAWVGIVLSTLFWTLLIALVYAGHSFWDPQLKLAHRLASIWGRGLVGMAPGSRVKLTGREHLPAGRPVIFMANHQSYVDVPALFFVPAQFKWMADMDLFRIPVFGRGLARAGYVGVRRGDGREAVRSLQKAERLLKQGISVFVFPEGTRSHTGVLGRFQSGGFRLAADTGVPIVPVVVSGTRQLLPRGDWVFRWGARVWIDLLPAMDPPANRREIRPRMAEVRARMREACRRMLKDLR